jgi:hypothetical protein
MWYDFYPTSCLFSIPEPWRGDRKHTTSWIKIISHHKTWSPRFFLSHIYHPIHVFIDFILWKAWRRNTQCENKNLSHECYISHWYQGKYVIKSHVKTRLLSILFLYSLSCRKFITSVACKYLVSWYNNILQYTVYINLVIQNYSQNRHVSTFFYISKGNLPSLLL